MCDLGWSKGNLLVVEVGEEEVLLDPDPLFDLRTREGDTSQNYQGSETIWIGNCNYFTEMCSGSEAGSYLRLIHNLYLKFAVLEERREAERALPEEDGRLAAQPLGFLQPLHVRHPREEVDFPELEVERGARLQEHLRTPVSQDSLLTSTPT